MSIQLANGRIVIQVPADFNMGYMKGYCEAEKRFDHFLDCLFYSWSVRFWQNPFYCSNFSKFWKLTTNKTKEMKQTKQRERKNRDLDFLSRKKNPAKERE